MTRVVADTNTIISGLLWRGPPRRLIDLARSGALTVVTSATLLAELAEVIAREKFFSRVVEAGLTAGELVRDFADLSEVVEALPLTTRISRDPEDDHVLACACAASADLIVSGDRDLLALESFQGIPVVTATKALDRMLRA